MKDSQRKLFTEEQWTELNNLWSKRKEWIPIEKGIQKELKCIEQLAVDNVQAVYVKYLEYQMRYALNENETYFEVYGAIVRLKLLHNNRTILSSSTPQNFTEQD
ncbi:hypothetical protein G6F46_002830 [Rhizopus delemar]|uniref:Uncharacterized protein n=2 Tax=Rhizopus TaxID=4842 RepID=A0A9P6ZD28_9FUNG|nr:hypothetical protein G6F55_001370 [Rhizopus delemar]KAG1553490.1 hypothetical protein G6F51_000567 [Rhizopus arrhizus]KAG1505189.1 hypothetical protein G6F54_000485 [Rhizopus delemar]KAG1517693.1 hypothetical protein G6F53_001180 [Rhizopus delemar]KAG1562206.1 hypothetical protein G6F49_001113 [Rhizopus delemar]